MSKQVNVGCVGLGAFMMRQHIPNILLNPKFKIHHICRRDEQKLAENAKELGAEKMTTDAEEVFKDPDVDVVFIGTRHDTHAYFLEMGAKYGKDCFVEKPMTMNCEENKRVIKAVKESGINVGVGLNRRYAPSIVEAKKLFDAYRDGPSNIIYRIVDDHDVRPEYIFNMDDGGGHLLAECCHIFDLLVFLLGAEPVEVFAVGPLETDNIVVFKYDDDSIATILCGGKGGLFYPKEMMELFNNHTTLVLDHFFELRVDGPNGNLIKTFPLDVKSERQDVGKDMSDFYREHFKQRPKDVDGGAHVANKYFNIKPDKGHCQIIEAFTEAIAAGQPFSPGVIDGARATTCAMKAYDSIRKNKPIAIKPEEYGLEK